MHRRIALIGTLAVAGTVLAGAPAEGAQTRVTGDTAPVTAASSWKCNPKNHNPRICIKRTGTVLQLKLTYRGKYSGALFADFLRKRKGSGYNVIGSKTLFKKLKVSSKKGDTRYSPTFKCPKKAGYVQGSYAWNSRGEVTETPVIKCR